MSEIFGEASNRKVSPKSATTAKDFINAELGKIEQFFDELK